MKRLLILLCFLGLSVMANAQASGTVNNVDDNNTNWPQTGWKVPCVLPDCNPGGGGTPTASARTSGIASPSTDGASMLFSQTAPAHAGGTNILWVFIAGRSDTASSVTSTFKVYLDASFSVASQFEVDEFSYHPLTGIEYMFGHQCNFASGFWDVWNQLTTSWVGTTVPCNLSLGTWHTITIADHMIPTDTNSCGGGTVPCMYFDSLIIDGVEKFAAPLVYPAGPLPGSWTNGVGLQFQSNVPSGGSGGNPVKFYIDEANFSWNSNGSPAPPTKLHGITITCRGTPLSQGYLRRRGEPKLINVAQVSTPISLGSSLLIYWNADSSADSWTVKRSTVPGGPYTTLGSGLTQPGCVDNQVAPQTSYYYVVEAVNSIGTSPDSVEVQGTTP